MIIVSIKAHYEISASFIHDPTLLLKHILCIHQLVSLKKNKSKVLILIDFRSKVNIMALIYIANLDLKVHSTNVKAQKINSSNFEIFKMILANFQVEDKFEKTWFFKEIFLIVNTNIKMILNIYFLIFINANVLFTEQKLTWKLYISAKALSTTKYVQIVGLKKFVVVVLDLSKEIFIVYIAYLVVEILMHLTWKT